MKKKNFIIAVILLISFILNIILLIKHFCISNIEKSYIISNTTSTSYYLNYVEDVDNDNLDKYILFALIYSYNENNKSELKVSEIKEIIESKFDVKIKEDKLNDVGISPLLLENDVYHNPEDKIYGINYDNITQSKIAEIPIYIYRIDKIKKSGKKVIITYKKYVITNPYDVLNYYNDNTKKSNKQYDTTDIYNYLTCKGKMKDIIEAVNDENVDNFAKYQNKVKVTYKIVNDDLIVEKVK